KPQVTAKATATPAKVNAPTPVTIAKPDGPIMPAARVTSRGVVTGPVTMPSVPTGTVVAENLMENATAPAMAAQDDDEKTLMERHQEQQIAMAQDTTPPAPQDIAPSAQPLPPLQAEPLKDGEPVVIQFTQGHTQVDNPKT